MRRQLLLASVVLLVAVVAGCGPTVTVNNTTKIPVRVIVTSPAGSSVLSPSPGESSTAEVQAGPYRVTVIQDAEWLAYAKLTRQYLNDQLANSDQLTGPQLLEVVRRLKDVAAKMQAFEQAAGSTASCAGKVDEEGAALVDISQAATGALVASCR